MLQLVLDEPDDNPLLQVLKTETLKHLKVTNKNQKVIIPSKLTKPALGQIIMMTAAL